MQALEIAVPPRALPRMRATTDLAEVAHDTLPEAPRDPAWSIRERRFSPATEPSVEARFSVSNGLVGVRGSLEEEASSPHPRTLAAGLFDPLDGDVAVPGLVPAPDYLGLRMYVDGVPIGYETSGVRSQVRTLDLRRAALWREWSYDDGNGGSVRVRTLRFASAVHRALTVHVTEISADHHVELLLHQQCARCDAHLVCVSSSGHRTVWETKNRKRRLYVARSSILERAPGHCERITPTDDGSLLSVRLEPNSPVTLTRLVAMAPDWALGDQEALDATLERACRAGGSRLLDEHVDAWRRRWHASDVEVAGDDRAQRALRFAAYHLLSAANPGSDVASVGARGLTGDAYWGHVFWDTDIFLLPFYTFTWPEAARAMLMYRHRGLDAA